MKILRITQSMNPKQGGVVEAINQAALSFNSQISTMDVLCFDAPDSPWLKVPRNYTVYAIGEGKTAYGFNFYYLKWLYRNAKNYDTVIIDGLWQFYVTGGYLLKLIGVPYCVFVHGMMSPYFNKDRLKFLKKLPFWLAIDRNVIAMASKVIFTCEEERNLATVSLPFYRGNAVVATLGVTGSSESEATLKDSFEKQFPELKNKKILLYLSRLHAIKGIDMLIDALAQIDNYPTDYILAIAGPGTKSIKEELVKQITKLGLQERVVFLGMLSGEVKWGAYKAADVFILPSHQENFGIVVAEALSTSTPVLITNKVNIWREIQEGGAGFIENDDVLGVKALLVQWFALADDLKSEMSMHAFTCYEDNFSTYSATVALNKVIINVAKS